MLFFYYYFLLLFYIQSLFLQIPSLKKLQWITTLCRTTRQWRCCMNSSCPTTECLWISWRMTGFNTGSNSKIIETRGLPERNISATSLIRCSLGYWGCSMWLTAWSCEQQSSITTKCSETKLSDEMHNDKIWNNKKCDIVQPIFLTFNRGYTNATPARLTDRAKKG